MRRSLVWSVYTAYVALLVGYWGLAIGAPRFHSRWVQGEMGAVEWLTFVAFAAASVGVGSTLWRWRAMTWRARAYMMSLALFFFTCAGEELSWGQHLLGFRTPELVARANVQREFNIHNLELPHFHPKDVVSWFMKVFGILAPLALWKRLRQPDSPLRRYVAAPCWIPCFVFAEGVNVMQRPITSWLRAVGHGPLAAIVGPLTEELVELYWGLSVLFAVLGMARAWRRKPLSLGGAGI